MQYKVGDKVKVQTGAVWTVCTVLEAIEAEVSSTGRLLKPIRYKLLFPRGGEDWRSEDKLLPALGSAADVPAGDALDSVPTNPKL